MIKIKEWARRNCVDYSNALDMFHSGKISGKQLPTGTILIDEDPKTACKAIDKHTGKSFTVSIDIDINARGFSGQDQAEILEEMNRLVDLCGEKLGFGVLSKQWIP